VELGWVTILNILETVKDYANNKSHKIKSIIHMAYHLIKLISNYQKNYYDLVLSVPLKCFGLRFLDFFH